MEWLDAGLRLLVGLRMTILLILAAAPAGVAIGVIVGIARVYGPGPVRVLAFAYQSAFRGIPLVMQLFIIYYVLPRIGLRLDPFPSAVLAFGLCSGAYHSEYVRSALLSIPTGQLEGGLVLGMRRSVAVRAVILPQALRKAVPGCGNELIYLIKYSSLAYLVTLVDLTGAGRLQAYASFRFFETFLIVGMIYLAMVTLARFALRRIERRWRCGLNGRAATRA